MKNVDARFLPNGTYEWPHFLLLSFYIFVVLSILAFVISITDKKGQKDHGALLRIDNAAKPDKQVKALWIVLCLVMVALYVFFNGH